MSSAIRRPPAHVLVGLALVVAMVAFGIALDTDAVNASNLRVRLQAPTLDSVYGLLGTDNLGRSLFHRIAVATGVSVLIGFVGAAVGMLVGSAIGLIAAYVGGWIDQVVVFLIDVATALPFIVVVLAALAVFGSSLEVFLVLVGLNGWERYARVVRNQALVVLGSGYVDLARVAGARAAYVITRHVAPNVAFAVLVLFTLNVASTILLESALSFLGLGIQPPMTSLGSLAGRGRDYLLSHPWLAIAPSLMLVHLTLTIGTLGDWASDLLDPRLRQEARNRA